MKATELRIGNIVLHEHPVFDEKKEIHIVDHESFYRVQKFPDSYSGVLITEEWLLKCGLEKDEKENGVFFSNGAGFELYKFNVFGDFCYKCGNSIEGNFVNNRVDYVHQLQNLYFALTGDELEFNIEKT